MRIIPDQLAFWRDNEDPGEEYEIVKNEYVELSAEKEYQVRKERIHFTNGDTEEVEYDAVELKKNGEAIFKQYGVAKDNNEKVDFLLRARYNKEENEPYLNLHSVKLRGGEVMRVNRKHVREREVIDRKKGTVHVDETVHHRRKVYEDGRAENRVHCSGNPDNWSFRVPY